MKAHNLLVTGSLTAGNGEAISSISSSVASTTLGLGGRITTIEGRGATTGSNTFQGIQTINGSLIVTGSLTAQQFIVSSSVTYLTTSFASGSTAFGDSLDDTMKVTGSVYVTGSYNVNASTLYVTGSNVGVGMTPIYKLDVSDAIRGLDIIAGGNTFSYDGTLRARNASNNTNVLLHSNGSSYLMGGNFGIGITTPATPIQILKDTNTNGTNIEEANMAFTVLSAASQTKTAIGACNAGNYGYIQVMQDATSWTNRYLVLQPRGGRVGIGTYTPDRLLTVNGDATLLGNNYISTSKFFQWEGGAYWATRVTSSGNQFEIYRGDTGISPFVITSSNLVQVSFTGQTDDIGLFQIYNSTAASGSGANASLTTKNYNGTGQFMMWENYGMRIGSRIKTNTGAGGIYFTYGNDTVGMNLTSTGVILLAGASSTGSYDCSLGNATANTYYQVRSLNTNSLFGADTRGTWIGNLSSKETYTNGGHFVPGVDNTVYCGSSSYRWAAVFAVNGAIQTSDQRLKTNIQTSDLGLDFITRLNPVSYKWIVGGNTVEYSSVEDENGKLTPTSVATPVPGRRSHYGLIAQQVKEVLGDKDFGGFVYDEETDTMSLRYDQFISPLIKAIQEQQQMITDLQTQINNLKQI